MTDAVLRPARLADADAISKIHLAAWRTAYRGLVPDQILDGRDLVHRTRRWHERLARPADGARIWVVEQDGAIRGYAATGPADAEAAPPPSGAGELESIYIEPSDVGRGLGRRLLAHATTDLLDRGFAPIVIWVFEDNARARRFYESAGARPDGTRHDIHFDGVPVAEVRYLLRPGRASTRTNVPDRA